MGLFGFDPVKEAGGWEAAMTEEEIAEMEKKGYDMSSVRGRQTEMAAQEEADKAAFADRRKAAAVPTDLNKLTPYRSTPRSAESSFFGMWPERRPSLAGRSGGRSMPTPPWSTVRWYRPTATFGSPVQENIFLRFLYLPWTAPIFTMWNG